MKKVIHVLTDRNMGGAGRWLLYYLQEHDRENYAVSVLLPPDSILLPQVQALGVPTLLLPSMVDRSWDKASLKGMVALFRREKPDIVHTHASLTARIAARLAGVPAIIASKHCMEEPGGGLSKGLLRRVIGKLFTTKIIAVSHAVEKSLADGGTDPRQIVTIYNGIRPSAPPTAEEEEQIRKTYGLDPRYHWVGIVARMEPVKGVDIFVQSALEILKQRQDVSFLICGLGSQERLIRDMVRGQEEYFVFGGLVSQVEKVMSLMDLVVASSRQEALCLSALESMSMAVPAVGTRTGGISEVIREGETGLLVPPEDPKALAGAVMALLEDPQRRKEMGQAGQAMVQREFLASVMVCQVQKLYDAVVKTERK